MRKVITSRPTVLIPYAPGTNCEEETMRAFWLAGAKPKLAFLKDLASRKIKITDCDICCFPGGFSFGDYVGTGVIASVILEDEIPLLTQCKKPTGGICNGFQVLVRRGFFGQLITLAQNICKTFRAIPVQHRVEVTNCIWTRGLEGRIISFPSAHGYGRLVGDLSSVSVAMTYVSESPNGGVIAAITTGDGTGFGVMDHPERPEGNEDGLLIFKNIVEAVR